MSQRKYMDTWKLQRLPAASGRWVVHNAVGALVPTMLLRLTFVTEH